MTIRSTKRDMIVLVMAKPFTFKAIADAFGVSVQSVRNIASANGFTAIGRAKE